MSDKTKINLFLLLAFIAVCTCRFFQSNKPKNEIEVNGMHISKNPCESSVSDLLGESVDSSKICDCLLPKYYYLIKEDSALFEDFRRTGSFGTLNDSLTKMFGAELAECVKNNVLDSTYRLQLTETDEIRFKRKLAMQFQSRQNFDSVDAAILSDCIVTRLNGRITVKEYFSNDFAELPEIKELILGCLDKSK